MKEFTSGIKDRFQGWIDKRIITAELHKLGVTDFTEALPSLLPEFDLSQLRRMHEVASDGNIGSIDVEFGTFLKDVAMVDVGDTSYKHLVNTGDSYMSLHFEPYAVEEKLEEHINESMFLGFTDLLRVIEVYRDKDVPEFIKVSTNPVQAAFAIRKLGFHPYGGTKNNGKEERELYGSEVLELIDSRKRILSGVSDSSDDLVGLFIKSKDFFSDDMMQKLTSMRELLYRRITRDTTQPILQDNLDKLEHQARHIAIMKCIQNLEIK